MSAMVSAEGGAFSFPPTTKVLCACRIHFYNKYFGSGKVQGPRDVLKHNCKPSYFDIQKDMQEGLVGIKNCLAPQAYNWKENQNTE